MNTHAIALLAPHAGGALTKHLTKILSAMMSALSDSMGTEQEQIVSIPNFSIYYGKIYLLWKLLNYSCGQSINSLKDVPFISDVIKHTTISSFPYSSNTK